MATSPAPKPSVSLLLVQPLAFGLASSADLLERFLARTGLTPELLANPDERVSAAQFHAAWEFANDAHPQGSLALALAESIPAGSFGVVEYVCRSAATLREALGQWTRYLRLLNGCVEVGFVACEDRDRVALRVLAETAPRVSLAHELCFALLASRVREIVAAPVAFLRVEFEHRASQPEDIRAYRRWFDGEVSFGAPHTQIVFERSALETELTTADPRLHAILERVAAGVGVVRSDPAPEPPSVRDEVARVVQTLLPKSDANVHLVAQRMRTTPRSLQRRLHEERTTFQNVRENVRRSLAEQYLESGLTISEIAFMVGFSDSTAFFRAFKRWTGLTPLESREARLKSHAP